LALIAAYIEEVRVSLIRMGTTVLQVGDKLIPTATASMDNLMQYYSLHFLNPNLIAGAFIGAMLPFVFSALTMTAVGKVAHEMVLEVRRQFKEIKGIMTGRGKPDYAACVTIATKGAQKQMILPSLSALLSPIIVGLIFGVAGVVGLLVGSLISGFALAIFMANAGGAWDNAKKYIEEGNLGGKGSACHKASVIGDTVGDPFKDTSGPSLNILIKLMSMVAVVTAGITVSFHLLGK
jgi:K(+)-stimulated pyrophosphate-energized sodium pump